MYLTWQWVKIKVDTDPPRFSRFLQFHGPIPGPSPIAPIPTPLGREAQRQTFFGARTTIKLAWAVDHYTPQVVRFEESK